MLKIIFLFFIYAVILCVIDLFFNKYYHISNNYFIDYNYILLYNMYINLCIKFEKMYALNINKFKYYIIYKYFQ